MNAPKTDSNAIFHLGALYRFIGGAGIGILLLCIAVGLSYPTPDWHSLASFQIKTLQISPLQIGGALFLILCCGLLASLWGKAFFKAVMNLFDSFSGF